MKNLAMYFFSCHKAENFLQTDADIKRQWMQAVRWLREQLEVSEVYVDQKSNDRSRLSDRITFHRIILIINPKDRSLVMTCLKDIFSNEQPVLDQC